MNILFVIIFMFTESSIWLGAM